MAAFGGGVGGRTCTWLCESSPVTEADMQPWRTHTQLFQPGQDGGHGEAIRTKEYLTMILNSVTTAGLGSIDAHQNIVKNVTS